jgi:type IV secretory pathway VirB10-like protein
MAKKRAVALLVCTASLIALLAFWPRSSKPSLPSQEVVTTSTERTPPAAAPDRQGTPFVPPNVRVPKAPPLPAVPRPITDAPHFSTMQEYRAEQAARTVPPESLAPAPSGRTPEKEVLRIQGTVRKYRAAFGQNPVGSNPEITRALAGKNPTGAKFLDPDSTTVNEKGEMLDDWGMPYFFHPVSGSIMEIRSAGPDKKLFTPDDIVR